VLHSGAIPDGDSFVSAGGNVGFCANVNANHNAQPALVSQDSGYRHAKKSALPWLEL